ncbi:hypothetical protein BC832DRAFT_184970 [Gaertneriomyces semiglobifer]|nr:hypothetical protein BC832DRAFT_184970 [Gaertneriomyces semiglobifer]
MASLLPILERLRKENLHGPTCLYNPQATTRIATGKTYGHHKQDSEDCWVLLDEEVDLDAKDPRWCELFVEFFIEDTHEGHDDLLFFVRDASTMDTQNNSKEDPIFVRRKVGKVLPPLDNLVDWKQTFFLNLIVQTPCTLTVAICEKGEGKVRKASLLGQSEERIVVVGGSTSTAQTSTTGASVVGSPETAPASSPPPVPHPNHNSTPSQKKSRMRALRRVPKTVYAAPYKSRMDIKDAFMNECSYPLVYYTVNDYESHDLHLSIRENEYLCVELSVIIPSSRNSSPSSPAADLINEIPISEDTTPFPTPAEHIKIVLFQGAVPYTSLLDIFEQKSLTAQNQLKSGWRRVTDPPRARMGREERLRDINERTEYIMMRGPQGKGQCQVAIKQDTSAETPTENSGPMEADQSVESGPSISQPTTSPSLSTSPKI